MLTLSSKESSWLNSRAATGSYRYIRLLYPEIVLALCFANSFGQNSWWIPGKILPVSLMVLRPNLEVSMDSMMLERLVLVTSDLVLILNF